MASFTALSASVQCCDPNFSSSSQQDLFSCFSFYLLGFSQCLEPIHLCYQILTKLLKIFAFLFHPGCVRTFFDPRIGLWESLKTILRIIALCPPIKELNSYSSETKHRFIMRRKILICGLCFFQQRHFQKRIQFTPGRTKGPQASYWKPSSCIDRGFEGSYCSREAVVGTMRDLWSTWSTESSNGVAAGLYSVMSSGSSGQSMTNTRMLVVIGQTIEEWYHQNPSQLHSRTHVGCRFWARSSWSTTTYLAQKQKKSVVKRELEPSCTETAHRYIACRTKLSILLSR